MNSHNIAISAACVLAVLLSCPALAGGAALADADASARDVLFQVSTITALMNGMFDGSMSLGELKAQGDFGLGTFDRLDGEMVVLDGQIFQVKDDGVAYSANDSMSTPFALITYFDRDEMIEYDRPANMTVLEEIIESMIPNKNLFYALRIDGTFDHIRTRSVPAQSKPYPGLTEATGDQSLFELYNQTGTIVGFWSPAFVSGINVPGYHLHFINEKRTAGGHVLDFTARDVSIALDQTSQSTLFLPTDENSSRGELGGVNQSELRKAEGNPSGL